MDTERKNEEKFTKGTEGKEGMCQVEQRLSKGAKELAEQSGFEFPGV